MGMMNCADCGERIAGSAIICPRCGSSTPSRANNILRTIGLVIMLIVGLGILALVGQMGRSDGRRRGARESREGGRSVAAGAERVEERA